MKIFIHHNMVAEQKKQENNLTKSKLVAVVII